MFLETLKSLTQPQLRLYLKFVWGRVDVGDFSRVFRHNVNYYSNLSNKMPVGHTCGFSIDVGEYDSLEKMKKMFVYAIENCQIIADEEGFGGITFD